MDYSEPNTDAVLWLAGLRRRERWAEQAAADLEREQACAFVNRAGSHLYFIHRSTKGYAFQCSHFIKGLGPISDTQHQSATGVFAGDARGAGLSPSLQRIPLAELEGLIASFMPKKGAAG